ncbi:hypothetical protein F4779DRAFT_604916 [Xylariaceae sp. FL0662B]|nr:hypothetical protein F4779DRAFT_604916 [Xylariaceae sp. FL0662B]
MNISAIPLLLTVILLGSTNGQPLHDDNLGLTKRDDWRTYYGKPWSLNMSLFVICMDLCRNNQGLIPGAFGAPEQVRHCEQKCSQEVGEASVGTAYYETWQSRTWKFPAPMMVNSAKQYRDTLWRNAGL